jgi:hypothetical protein
MKKKIAIILSSVTIFMISCATQCNRTNPSEECKNVACTMDFRMITPNIIDTSGAIIIQKTETVLNGNIILIQDSSTTYNQYYSVIDDSNMKDLVFREESEVFFRIYSNGAIIKEVSYLVTKDCCHVSKVSGPEQIYL